MQEKEPGAYQDLHAVEHAICGDEVVCDAHPVWFHGMAVAVSVGADIRCMGITMRVDVVAESTTHRRSSTRLSDETF